MSWIRLGALAYLMHSIDVVPRDPPRTIDITHIQALKPIDTYSPTFGTKVATQTLVIVWFKEA